MNSPLLSVILLTVLINLQVEHLQRLDARVLYVLSDRSFNSLVLSRIILSYQLVP